MLSIILTHRSGAWPEDMPKDLYVSRTLFYALCPEEIHAHEIREASCKICREADRSTDDVKEANTKHAKDCSCGEEDACAPWLQGQGEEEKKQYDKWKADIAKQEIHINDVKQQCSAMVNDRLFPDGCTHNKCITTDFTQTNDAYDIRLSMADSMKGIQCLEAVVHTKNPNYDPKGPDNSSNRPYLSQYYDIFAKDTNDKTFFERAFVCLAEDFNVFAPEDNIKIWSDGGPKHFQTRRGTTNFNE